MIDYIIKSLKLSELAKVLLILGLAREARLTLKLLLTYRLTKRK
ncbi:hypothetical protein [Streptococcus equinus]|uniref:Uncharacterized protein n=1 Tax=Streptococcus equinus TaxID=1335 RepID=A0A1G9KDC5_STREI|nr:hypothetical protein [Streptococcus equinus]SDL47592.1 hypothetical protein SAMN05216400_0786 [Streptococcus equinus]SFF76849.1 hypothetical protein SAMN05216385_0394 [Streptococcus equinus]